MIDQQNNQADQYVIRPIQSTDDRSFFALMQRNREEMKNYFPITSKENLTLVATKLYVSKKASETADKKFFAYVVVDHESQEIIGYLIFKNVDWDVPKCELAYLLDHRFTGQGMMTSFVKRFADFGFDQLGFRKIYAIVSVGNPASLRVVQKAGFVEEGLLISHYRNGSGKLEDVHFMAITRAE